MRLPFLRPAAAALLCGLAGPGAAQTVPPEVIELRLMEGWRRDDGAQVTAIVIRLEPGWHTYWRVPGAAGFPPRFDWTASGNLAAVGYEWPRPILFDTYGAPTLGFKETLVLPVVLTPRDPDAPIDASVDVAFGVCNDICIPAEARLVARLDADAAAPEGRGTIERALAARPTEAGAAGVTGARCALGVDAAGPMVTAEITFAEPPAPGLTTVIEADARPDLWIGTAATETDGRRVRATARLEAAKPGAIALDRQGLRLTLLDARRAIDIRGCPGPGG